MSDIISISSDEDIITVEQTGIKKRKIIRKPNKTKYKPVTIIVLKDSDDEDADQNKLSKQTSKENLTQNKKLNRTNKTFASITDLTSETLSEMQQIELLCKKEIKSELKTNKNDNHCTIEKNITETVQNETNIIKDTNINNSTLEIKNQLTNNNNSTKITNIELTNTDNLSLEKPDNDQDKNIDEESDYIVENEYFRNFLNACMSEKISSHDQVIIEKCIGKIRKRYQATNKKYLDSMDFNNLLQEKITAIENNPRTVVIHFKDVFIELKRHKNEMICTNRDDAVKKKTIKNLQKILRKLQKKIKELEQQELSLEDDWDDNSMYIQEARYKKRFNTVYQKLCHLTGESKHAGRLSHTKLNYQQSKIQDINDAVNNFYEKKRIFPNFEDIDKCIRDCIVEKNLNLTPSEVDFEIQQALTNVGKILKTRRYYELKESLETFNEEKKDDPACNSDELNEKLKSNKIVNEKKLNEVFELYVKKQELGEDCISENSYNSDE